MKSPFRKCLLPFFAAALMAPVARAGDDDEAAAQKFTKPGDRVVREGAKVVELHTLGARDEDLAGLNRLKSLRVLGLTNSRLTDAGLKHLAGMDSLKELHLYNSLKITGTGLKEVAGNRGLERLWVDGWQLNDE